MIICNGKLINQEAFGDGTLKMVDVWELSLDNHGRYKEHHYLIKWMYDSDAEMFALMCIVNDIRERDPLAEIDLMMPYIPHARQDRRVSGKSFTLKYFAKFLNSLNFKSVNVLDAHSDVSLALIDRIQSFKIGPYNNEWEKFRYKAEVMDTFSEIELEYVVVMFPDAGAAKRYKEFTPGPDKQPIIGNKERNSEGRIIKYDLLNFIEGTKFVVIRDDICSYGGTFVEAAKALRAKGVEKIALYVSHCENNIFKGDALKYIDYVFTTDSLQRDEHNKIINLRRFREYEDEK